MKNIVLCFLVSLAFLGTFAEGANFKPFVMGSENTEDNTCVWLRADLGGANDILPLKTREWATKESVTGGVAVKFVFDPGSMGIAAMEYKVLPKGSAGVTFYAKASEPLNLKVSDLAECAVTKEWKKFDIPWEKFGGSSSEPKLGWQLKFNVPYPVEKKTVLWLDRIGFESPEFEKNPVINPESGEDAKISSKELIYGAENMSGVISNLKQKKEFKVVAFGDSVTAGAQRFRSTWGLSKHKKSYDFLYYSHLTTLMNESFGYKGVKYVYFGHGGWTSAQGLAVADGEMVKEAGPDDLVIIQFGGNDLMGRIKIPEWKANTKKLIAKARTKTKNILIMGVPYGEPILPFAEGITKTLKELVNEERVAAFDFTKFSLYRGSKFAGSIYANPFHPDYVGHMMLAEMMLPMFTGKPASFPE